MFIIIHYFTLLHILIVICTIKHYCGHFWIQYYTASYISIVITINLYIYNCTVTVHYYTLLQSLLFIITHYRSHSDTVLYMAIFIIIHVATLLFWHYYTFSIR